MPLLKTFDFSLRQLQYAVAIAETGAFGRAAEACGVSQPSLSAQVARLEEALGVQLFERHARGTLVTAAGKSLLAQMRVALEAARELDAVAVGLGDPTAITLNIGVIPTVAPYLLPAIVRRLTGGRPGPRIHWVEAQTEVCEAELADGGLDAMIIADPPSGPHLASRDLGFEPFWVVTPPGLSLARQVSLEAMAKEELLLLEEGHCLRDQAMDLCMLPGALESPFRATSLPTLVQMVASGLGVSVLPASAIPVELSRADVWVRPFASREIGRTLRLSWRARSAFGDYLEALAPDLSRSLKEAVKTGARAAKDRHRTGG